MAETKKVFNWQSESEAKDHYSEWLASLAQQIGSDAALYCLSETETDLFRPEPPLPLPPNSTAALQREHHKATVEYKNQLRKFYTDFGKAIATLRSSFMFNSKVYNDTVEALTTIPAGTADNYWTPDRQFRAAMNMLRNNYSPNNATDVALIRTRIGALTDISCGGFHEYASEFTSLHLKLINANQPPTANECSEWVKAGIKNVEIKNMLAVSILRPGSPVPTYQMIFEEVRTYLKKHWQ